MPQKGGEEEEEVCGMICIIADWFYRFPAQEAVK